MRKKVIAGNWKMHMDLNESIGLISGIKNGMTNVNSKVILCPPYTSLETASTLLKGTEIGLGAQNIHFEDTGAFTGEVSAKMIKSVGCQYVILGHSERRAIFNESDEMINKKIKKALSEDLNVIFCIGETLEQRESNVTKDVVGKQIKLGLEGIAPEQMKNIIIAYEPVWAIGTGKTASPEQAQEVHLFIRELVGQLYNNEISDELIIQYGGSVKPANASELLSQNDIDGALVGGACLEAESFLAIIKAV
ncbi:MAG: triose-phosphate isomerase [Melioribacteraceae bacterium]|nr:triose-phosphate isomerase [Melioribacteraceae bacterium]MCF8353510.1 triose-phosphate isomerase [Melioribacteraceae bacterium]MCF8392639.1 triose-phosphate isomerase [Melioribacteraceae bacterium]MCF8418489.1 triose-phosphate isomerase [Melioribacteraceae bacterium]